MRRFAFIGLVLTVLTALSCEGEFATQESDVVTSPNGQTLVLTATPDNLDITGGGAITILAELYVEGGDPLSGVDIVFTSTLGTVGETRVVTDADGIAITTLAATSRPGYAMVVATFKSMQAMVSVDFYQGDPNSSPTDGENPDFGDDTGTEDEGAV
ncbi:hypothetical protein K8I61_01105 [bacterium]|nr:hypothetical protein [bacterium]